MAIRISGLNSGLDTDSIVQELVSAQRTKQEKYTKAQTKLSWKQDAWKEMNTKIYDFYSKTLSDMRRVGNYTKKKTTVSDSTKATVTASSKVTNGTQTLEVEQLATAGYLTGKKVRNILGSKTTSNTRLAEMGVANGTLKLKVGEETKTINVTTGMTVSELTKALNDAGITANFDENQQRFIFNSAKSGKDNDFNFVTEDEASLRTLASLGLATKENYEEAAAKTGDATLLPSANTTFAHKEAAANAKIILNGAEFENDTNDFSINGLNITATGVTNGKMTITTSTDVDGIYDMIKGFFKEYNELINHMEKTFNAESAKGYEPLTDDEKDEMSEKEVEKWEQKIKDSILRRDDTLRSVMNSMSTNMAKVFTVNGKKYSLASFGIKTGGYLNAAENETYAYHIDGDTDDSFSSGNADSLKKMIAEDPDGVAEFFSQLATSVYDSLHEKMGSTTLSSAYKVYNDKQMKIEYDEYTKQIKKWEEKLKDMEDRYYKQFSQMETALGQLQSQTNSLTSLLGG